VGLEDLHGPAQVTRTNDIHCVTTWSRYDNTWVGVSMRTLLAQVKPFETAKFVMLRSYDGYSTNLPLADIDRDDVIIAHTWKASRSPASTAVPCDWWCRTSTSGSQPNGCATSLHGEGPAGLLGSARLSHARRSVARGAVWLARVAF